MNENGNENEKEREREKPIRHSLQFISKQVEEIHPKIELSPRKQNMTNRAQ